MSNKLEKFTIKTAAINLKKINFDEILKHNNPIIFDTNFLFITFEFKIDIISELKRVIGGSYNLYIYEGTIKELENIEKKKEKNKKFLPLIMKMLEIYHFKIIKSNQNYIDDQILENINSKIIIATNDKELRQELWDKKSKVLYMRQKKYLELK